MGLPLVVAGPVLRRVESNLVTVWIALSRPARVHLFVYLGMRQADDGSDDHVTEGVVPTIAIGKNLHVATVTGRTGLDPGDPVDPSKVLAPNTTYSYDIIIVEPGDTPRSLRSMDLLIDESTLSKRLDGVEPDAPMNLALGYAAGQLPSFRTCPSTLEELVLVQTGCRASGKHAVDATGWIDRLIGDRLKDERRPHQLIMTGDQIYADSANTLLLPMANQIGAELLGITEKLILVEDLVPATIENFPAYRRGYMCKDRAGFTTGSANHLLTFGEFAAAYCLAWNPSMWRGFRQQHEIFTDDPLQSPTPSTIADELTPWEEFRKAGDDIDVQLNAADWAQRKTDRYLGWRKSLEEYRGTVARIRRAMANCPTYMIFDDHEVTDDWNMSKMWANRVYTTPLGRRVVRNALSAYAVFQGSGNDPIAWSKGNKQVLLDKIVEAWSDSGADDEYPELLASQDVEQLLGMPAKFPIAVEPVTWHYQVEGPAHRLAVVDTRTRRTYATNSGPPSLMGDSVNEQVPAKAVGDEKLLVLLVSQPPLMPALFTQIAQPLGGAVIDMLSLAQAEKRRNEGKVVAAHDLESGAEKLDAESWGLEEFGLEKLLARLVGHERVVILSGDVHFSYAMTMDYWKKGATTPSRFVQLVLSPSRSEWPATVHNLLRTTSLSERFAQLGHPAERLAWNEPDETPVAPQAPPGIAARAGGSPALLPAKGWPVGTELRTDVDGQPFVPDWTWRLDLVVDDRPETDRPESVRLPVLPTVDLDEPDPADPVGSYLALASVHQRQTTQRFSHLRRLVFPTAIGVVTFLKPDDDRPHQVRHEIWTSNPRDPAQVDLAVGTDEPNTAHVIDLAPTTEPQPILRIGVPGGF